MVIEFKKMNIYIAHRIALEAKHTSFSLCYDFFDKVIGHDYTAFCCRL